MYWGFLQATKANFKYLRLDKVESMVVEDWTSLQSTVVDGYKTSENKIILKIQTEKSMYFLKPRRNTFQIIENINHRKANRVNFMKYKVDVIELCNS